MPRYYFDTQDGDKFIRDDLGLDLDGIEAAKRHAIAALPDMARDALPDGERRDFVVGVRDGDGTYILKAVLSFTVMTGDPG